MPRQASVFSDDSGKTLMAGNFEIFFGREDCTSRRLFAAAA
jgi:hypothetical protein